MNPPIVIAEVGCNHKGSLEIAKEMIVTASLFVKADYVKFQKRNVKELLSPEEYAKPHPNPCHAFGDSYGAHREFLEFNLDQHSQIKKWCDELKIGYFCSVWDVTSAKEITSLEPKMIKVPSACNLNKNLLSFLADTFPGEIHISLGMTDQSEEEQIVSFFESKKRSKDLVIYSCVSGYPVQFEDIALKEIVRLQSRFGKRVKAIGFSGHHLGIAADIAAMVLGAAYIERHYTLDRTWKGTDHAASLEPDGLRRLCRDLRNVAKGLDYKKQEILEVEIGQRQKLKQNQIIWDAE